MNGGWINLTDLWLVKLYNDLKLNYVTIWLHFRGCLSNVVGQNLACDCFLVISSMLNTLIFSPQFSRRVVLPLMWLNLPAWWRLRVYSLELVRTSAGLRGQNTLELIHTHTYTPSINTTDDKMGPKSKQTSCKMMFLCSLRWVCPLWLLRWNTTGNPLSVQIINSYSSSHSRTQRQRKRQAEHADY